MRSLKARFHCGLVALVKLGMSLHSFGAAPNDDFAEAIPLMGGSHHETMSIVGATLEPGEPAAGDATGTLWWRWTAPVSGRVFIRARAIGSVTVWQGPDVSLLQYVNAARLPDSSFAVPPEWLSSMSFPVQSGEAYMIRVAGPSFPFETQVWFTLDLSTVELLAPSNGFAIPEGQPVVLNTSQPNPLAEGTISNLVFHVLGSFPIDEANQIPGLLVPATNESGLTAVVASLPPNEYRVHATCQNAAGQFVATLTTNTFFVRPANDDFAEAHEISTLPYSQSLIPILAATEELDEPANVDQFDGRSVWWRWTAPRDMIVVARGLTTGAFQGSGVVSLQPVGYERFASLRLSAVAGQTYHFRTTSRSTMQLPLPLSLGFFRLTELGGNDDFEDRQTWVGDEVAFAAPSEGSYEPDEPMPESPHYPFYGSFWWTWRAPENGLLLLTGQPPAIDGRPGIFDVYSGISLEGLQRLAWELEPALPGWRKYQVLAGEDVQLALNAGTWPFTMRLRFIPQASPASNLQLIRASSDHISLATFPAPAATWYLQSSVTLTNWVQEQVVPAGAGTPIFFGPIDHTEDRRFYRLSDTPAE